MGVVVGDAAAGVDDAAGDEVVAFGPVDLEVAGGKGGEPDAGVVAAAFIDEGDGVALFEVAGGGVIGIDEDGVARGAVKGGRYRRR